MTVIGSPFKTRDSFEVMKIRKEREELKKAIDVKVNESVQKYLEEGKVTAWCVVS